MWKWKYINQLLPDKNFRSVSVPLEFLVQWDQPHANQLQMCTTSDTINEIAHRTPKFIQVQWIFINSLTKRKPPFPGYFTVPISTAKFMNYFHLKTKTNFFSNLKSFVFKHNVCPGFSCRNFFFLKL